MKEIKFFKTGGMHFPELLEQSTIFPLIGVRLQSEKPLTMSSKLPEGFQKQNLVAPTLENKAFDALVKAKTFISKVAVHLPDETRKRLFLALDRLHEIEQWEKGDAPLLEQSFITFIRSILAIKPKTWPSLGMSSRGYIVATWGDAVDRINIQFLEFDWAKWTLSFKNEHNQILRSAGISPALDLSRTVAPYNPEHWFNAIRQNP